MQSFLSIFESIQIMLMNSIRYFVSHFSLFYWLIESIRFRIIPTSTIIFEMFQIKSTCHCSTRMILPDSLDNSYAGDFLRRITI
jgi:hypothetical protein